MSGKRSYVGYEEDFLSLILPAAAAVATAIALAAIFGRLNDRTRRQCAVDPDWRRDSSIAKYGPTQRLSLEDDDFLLRQELASSYAMAVFRCRLALREAGMGTSGRGSAFRRLGAAAGRNGAGFCIRSATFGARMLLILNSRKGDGGDYFMLAQTISVSKRFAYLLAIAALFAVPAAAQMPAPAAPNRVLVKFRAGAQAQIPQVERDEDIAETRPVGGTGVLLMQSRSRDTLTLVRNLRSRPEVEYAEPDYIVNAIGKPDNSGTLVPNDQYYYQLWGMEKISAPSAWGVTTGTARVAVGVVDSGVDYTHPDLAGNIWTAPDSYTVTVGGKQITCPAGSHGFRSSLAGRRLSCDPMDDNDHGTHVSGTIGAVGDNSIGVAGVNWTTTIVGLKFLSASGSGYTSDAINVIDAAVQLKQQGVNLRVLSNSWGGGGFSQALADEIAKAGSADMLFVAAAGNNGTNNDTTPFYPASYTNASIIAVAATDSSDALASWSNYGTTSVDLAAPGVNIYSTLPKATYGAYSGTSMATPHVSGAAALALAVCGTVDTAVLKADILGSVDRVLSGEVETGGRLNVSNLVDAIEPCSTTTTDFTITAEPASQTVTAGETATYAVTIGSIGGFKGSVVLSATGLPASFSPNPVTGSGTSTMTVTTTGVATGTYALTITGISGELTHSTTVTLVVEEAGTSTGDFAISASPAARSIPAGKTTTYTVTVTPSGGFSDTVGLAVDGLPSGASPSFTPPSIDTSGTSTLTIATPKTKGTYYLTITGTSGSLTHDTTVKLTLK